MLLHDGSPRRLTWQGNLFPGRYTGTLRIHSARTQSEPVWGFSAGITKTLHHGRCLTAHFSICNALFITVQPGKMNDSTPDHRITKTEIPWYCWHDPFCSSDKQWFFFFFHLLLTPHWVWYFHHTQVRRPGVNVPIATPPIGLSRGPAPGVVCIGAPITACHHFNK